MRPRRGSFLRLTRRANRPHLQFDAYPFIGLAVSLLCIFMTAPQPHEHHALDLVALTHAHPIPAIRRYDSIVISVMRDGAIYFGNAKVALEELPNRIHDSALNGSEKRVYLRVDARARYGDVSSVLPYVQLAGIQDVTFPVETPVIPRN
jgi:biopolymer transport protein TolR